MGDTARHNGRLGPLSWCSIRHVVDGRFVWGRRPARRFYAISPSRLSRVRSFPHSTTLGEYVRCGEYCNRLVSNYSLVFLCGDTGDCLGRRCSRLYISYTGWRTSCTDGDRGDPTWNRYCVDSTPTLVAGSKLRLSWLENRFGLHPTNTLPCSSRAAANHFIDTCDHPILWWSRLHPRRSAWHRSVNGLSGHQSGRHGFSRNYCGSVE